MVFGDVMYCLVVFGGVPNRANPAATFKMLCKRSVSEMYFSVVKYHLHVPFAYSIMDREFLWLISEA